MSPEHFSKLSFLQLLETIPFSLQILPAKLSQSLYHLACTLPKPQRSLSLVSDWVSRTSTTSLACVLQTGTELGTTCILLQMHPLSPSSASLTLEQWLLVR